MSNPYKEHPIDASYIVSGHLAYGKAVSEEKIFRNPPIRNNNCMWRPCLLANRKEMSILYSGPSIHDF